MNAYPYKALRQTARDANREIARLGLAIGTWGNVSVLDPDKGVFAIKPSGVAYDELQPEDLPILDMEGHVIDGRLQPSSDTPTHLVLYKAFPGILSIIHTHSSYAVSWAQAKREVPVFGTTHADHATGPIPCTALMTEKATKGDYELETGALIVERFQAGGLNPLATPMVLVAGHGPFCWGKNAVEAVHNASALEEICKMALFTLSLNPQADPLPPYLIEKHWRRKHGPDSYYGQKT